MTAAEFLAKAWYAIRRGLVFLSCAFIPQRVSTLTRPSACPDVDYFLWRLARTTVQPRESLCILKNVLQCCRRYAAAIR